MSAAKRKWRKTAGLKFRKLPWFFFTHSLERCSSCFNSEAEVPFLPPGATVVVLESVFHTQGAPPSATRTGFVPEFQTGGFPTISRRHSHFREGNSDKVYQCAIELAGAGR